MLEMAFKDLCQSRLSASRHAKITKMRWAAKKVPASKNLDVVEATMKDLLNVPPFLNGFSLIKTPPPTSLPWPPPALLPARPAGISALTFLPSEGFDKTGFAMTT
jgi:hypothetical protein